ncbi:MAG: DUF2848 domain-containing protein [Alphaproteobacteria bacterium]
MSSGIEFELVFVQRSGERRERVTIAKAVIGGWTARDQEGLRHHIEELARIGVARPQKTPLFYRVGARRLTADDAIEALGDGSSGEVEWVLLRHGGRLWVGAGSDHTDRNLEKQGISLAKQICDKPIARHFWPYDEVAQHWEQLELSSEIVVGAERQLYQKGVVASLLPPETLLDLYRRDEGEMADGTLLFGGTVAAIGGVRPADRFIFVLRDPVLRREITHAYDIRVLPDRG